MAAADIILNGGQAKKVVKRGTDLTDPELRAKLADKGATFTGKGRTGVQIPVSALVALDLIPKGADIDALLSEPAYSGTTRAKKVGGSGDYAAELNELLAERDRLDREVKKLEEKKSDISTQIAAAKRDRNAADKQARKIAAQVEAEANAALEAVKSLVKD